MRIIAASSKRSLEDVLKEIFKIYTANCLSLKGDPKKKRKGKTFAGLSGKELKHYSQWLHDLRVIVDLHETLEIPDMSSPKQDEDSKTNEAIAAQAARLQMEAPIVPVSQPTNLQGLIIANQNVNSNDLATKVQQFHEDLGIKITIIRVTNLDRERDALMNSFRPQREDYTEDAPSIANILDTGIDDNTIKDFAKGLSEFRRRKHSSIYKLEPIMRSVIRRNQKPKLRRELERLSNPDDKLTKEEIKQLKASINELIKEILSLAHVIVCTFVVAQTLNHKKLFTPQVVWINEASRKHETLIQWAQLGLTPIFLILTGDAKQDKPFYSGQNVRPNNDNTKIALYANYFKDQYMTSFSTRFKASTRKHMVFLSKNFRQHSGLEELSSKLFYDGEMKSSLNTDKPHLTAQMWHQYAQQLIRQKHEKRPPKQKDQCAEFLTNNRITIACKSNHTTIGLSSVDIIQAQRAVDFATTIHQAEVPKEFSPHHPTICIITPYAAQVDEIKKRLHKLSNQEICRELIKVRTQTAATSGE